MSRINVKREEVVKELYRLQDEGHSMKSGDFENWLYYGIQKHFGGWKTAKQELGIRAAVKNAKPSEPKKWTDDIIEIALKEAVSKGMSIGDLRKTYRGIGDALDRRFGGVKNASLHFGLSELPRKRRELKYSDDDFSKALRTRVDERLPMTRREVKSDETHSWVPKYADKRFGTWNNALIEHGIEPNVVRTVVSYSRDDVINAFLKAETHQDYANYTKAIKKHFGSVSELRRQLKIPIPAKEQSSFELLDLVTIDTKISELLKVDYDYITNSILNNADRSLVYSIRHHYGGLTEYFSQLDIDFYSKPTVPFKWDAKNLKRQLMRWIREGKPVNYTAVARFHKGIIEAARRHYGSWEGLFEGCGLNYDEFRTDTTLASFYGFKLEDVFEELLMELNIKFTRQPEINGCHPDFVSGNVWYDTKLSEWTVFHNDCLTVEKYEPHCEELIIVFLRGDKSTNKHITSKTKLVSIYNFVKLLPIDRQKIYINQLDEIINKVTSSDVGSHSKGSKKA